MPRGAWEDKEIDGKTRIIKSPFKRGVLTRRQIKQAVKAATMRSDAYIKIGRIGKMEVRISIDVEKVDNGFILHKEIYGVKMTTEMPDTGREIYAKFPDVQTRILELLGQIAGDLREAIPEKS